MESRRRMGAIDSRTRLRLLDAAEELMLEEGYAAVTTRRLARKAAVSPQLVHYYFRTMDDLFVEIFRRRADEGLARMTRALEVDRSLRTIWKFGHDHTSARFNIEFTALANHRKAVRAEIADYAERFRNMQIEAVASVLAERAELPAGITPDVVLVSLTGIQQIIGLEQALGVATGHENTLRFVERLIENIDNNELAGVREE